MKRDDAAKRVTALREQIRRHDRLYYVAAAPEIDDRAYDRLYRELTTLEADYPDLVTPDSPTQRVGGQPLEGFRNVRHAVPMLSLDNTYNRDELADFDRRVRRLTSGAPLTYVLEPKIDGVAVSLRYEDGVFVEGSTRGDKDVGDDITANLKTIRGLPLKLDAAVKVPPPLIEVRGEVYMTRHGFAALNETREEAGLAVFANTRNAAAGSLKQLDPRVVAQRPLAVVLYGLGEIEGMAFGTHLDLLAALKAFGLPVPPDYRHCTTLAAVFEGLDAMALARDGWPFEMDGGVIKVNERTRYEQLGYTARSPRWAIAYKYEPRRAETVLKAITVQVGRTGVLTPVAELEPVALAGSTVQRATLHNADEIARKDIRIGDHVRVEKAGEVIPAVIGVITAKRSGAEQSFTMPAACPACGEPVTRRAGEVAHRCENLLCPAQNVRRIEYFASRAAMDIEALGGIVARRLVESGLVKEPLDLFALKLDTLATLNLGTADAPRVFGPRNARRLLDALERARRAPLESWIHAIGIPHVGKATAIEVARVYGRMDALAQPGPLDALIRLTEQQEEARRINPASTANPPADAAERARRVDALANLNAEILELGERLAASKLARPKAGKQGHVAAYVCTGAIGYESARRVVAFFRSKAGHAFLDGLRQLGIHPTASQQTQAGGLEGATLVLTGTLEGMSREQAAEAIRGQGGKVVGSVSGNTDYLVVGAEPGARKLKQAAQHGVTLLDEAAFLNVLGTTPPAPPSSTPKQPELF